MSKRTKKFTMAMTEQEYDIVRIVSEMSGEPVAAFCRRAALFVAHEYMDARERTRQ